MLHADTQLDLALAEAPEHPRHQSADHSTLPCRIG
jgi:hypothetical protein